MNNVELKIEELTKKIEKEPNNAGFFQEREALYFEIKDYEKAKDDALKCLEIEPENPDYAVSCGNCFGWLEDYNTAIEYISKAIEKDDSNPYYYHCRGNCYQRINYDIIKRDADTQNRDGYEKSVGDYCKAIELDPNNAEYYDLIGGSYGWFGEWDKSHQSYVKALELEPENGAYLSEFVITSPDIEIHLGYEAISLIGNQDNAVRLDGKIKSLRENLMNDYNICLPNVFVIDSQHIKPAEIVMYADNKIIFQKEAEKQDFENIIDEIVNLLERLFSRTYLNSGTAA